MMGWIGLKDIHDMKNGLLMFKPLKRAFDNSRLVFVVDQMDQLMMWVLDPELRDVKLVDEWKRVEKEVCLHVFARRNTALLSLACRTGCLYLQHRNVTALTHVEP